ncbi:hypothetical protein [Arthrobacter sp. RIT-PI-e]|uniref:hypothetical protein n=1 Tax=Arthrobacter sp. RIT-PI-e TaxID=1681197 RepID=UPI00128EE435|nr:hypothetical protein [Arthrobacter sp. RIT-PI-e]
MSTLRLVRGTGVLLAVGFMSGCSADTGSVAIEVRSMTPDTQGTLFDVRVLGPEGELIASDRMITGRSMFYEGVPLGSISINADPLCVVQSTLTSEHPTMKLIVDGTHCILSD